MYKIEVDVTNLVEIVKTQNRLFYPVMIHILLKTISYREGFIYYQNTSGHFFKTLWNPSFEIFYKNYIFDLYKEKIETDIVQNSIVFALYENQEQKSDFVFLPLIYKNEKTFLPIVIQRKISEDFEKNLIKACLATNF